MGWLFWGTLGYILNGFSVAADKTLLGRKGLQDPAVYTLSISILGLLVFFLLPFGLDWPDGATLLAGMLSGLFFTAALYLMFTVLRVGEASRVPAFIGSVQPLFVFLGSLFILSERLNFWEVVAFALLLLGGWLMAEGKGGLQGKWMVVAIGSSLSFALAYIFFKYTFDHTDFISGLILTRVGGFISSLLLFFIPGTWANFKASFTHSSGGLKGAFVAGQTLAALGGLANSYGIKLGSVTLVNALQGIQYVCLFIISGIISKKFPHFYQDQFTLQSATKKAIATLIMTVGLALLAFGI